MYIIHLLCVCAGWTMVPVKPTEDAGNHHRSYYSSAGGDEEEPKLERLPEGFSMPRLDE